MRILVVDDHMDSASALARLLRAVGHDVRIAGSAADAFSDVVTDAPDLLISDLALTDGDGCELLRRVRAVHPHVRGIAVSGHTGEQYERQCRDAGYDVLISKPFAFEQLLAAVSDGRQGPGPAGNRRVLLVEDDGANRYAMGHMLKAAGFEVAEAATAAEALTMLTPSPCCVVLDWIIPGGGDSVLRHVRDNGLSTGVVIVTVAYEERREEISALRPDASLSKPITSAQLLSALRACAVG